jgi:hypothetical protein
LELLARHVARAFEPLEGAFANLPAFQRLCGDLGYRVSELPPAYAAVAGPAGALLGELRALPDDASAEQVTGLLARIVDLHQALRSLATTPAGVAAEDASDFLADFAGQLLEFLVVEYLARHQSVAFNLLEAIGAIASERLPSTPTRPRVWRRRFSAEGLRTTLRDPVSILERVYGWRTQQLDFGKLSRHVVEALSALGLEGVQLQGMEPDLALGLVGPDGALQQRLRPSIHIPVFHRDFGDFLLEIGFAIHDLPATLTKPAGLAVEPLLPPGLAEVGGASLEVPLGDRVVLAIRAGTDLGSKLAIVLRPDELSIRFPFAPGESLPQAGAAASFRYTHPEPFALLGAAAGTRLELQHLTAEIALDRRSGAVDVRAGVTANDLALVLAPGELDAFLGDLLGGAEKRLAVPLGIGWSNTEGLSFRGGVGFSATLAPNLQIGPVRLREVEVRLGATSDTGTPDLVASARATLDGELGPVTFSVQGVGLELGVVFDEGNLGPLHAEVGYRAPDGVGLRIDGEVVRGGGFLAFDSERGRYLGAVELSIANVSVKGLGLLTTREVGGFSLLLVISSEFEPIPLGYGFTLRGVGGLVGIRRRVALDALRQGLRTGAADAVLFPEDPVGNAPRLLADLETFFPYAPGRHLFAPMANIGWGTPTLLTAEVALLLELPEPIRLSILGQLACFLPSVDQALIELHIDLLGVLDFSAGTVEVDAVLRDSRLLELALSGEMALRARFRNDPTFALAFGGLHPRFLAPPGFPSLRRLRVNLGNGDNPRLTLDAYLAVTSNTLQLGALLELYAEAIGLNVHGYLGFDALFIFSPFSFEAEVKAGVALRRGTSEICGVRLEFLLSGPRPWRARGKAKFKVWIFTVTFSFEHAWGDDTPVELPNKAPWPELQAALADARSWSTALPVESRRAVNLSAAPPASGVVLADPGGGLEVRQRVLPLGIRLMRFGSARPTPPDRFDISSVSVADEPARGLTAVEEHFAPAQFDDLTDDERLSRPAFERMKAGVRSESFGIDADAPLALDLKYETVLVDVERPDWRRPADALSEIVAGSLAASSASVRAGVVAVTIPPGALSLTGDRFVIAGTDALDTRIDLLAEPSTAAVAERVLADHLRAHPEDANRLQVLSTAELAA